MICAIRGRGKCLGESRQRAAGRRSLLHCPLPTAYCPLKKMRYEPAEEVVPVKVGSRQYADGLWAIIGGDGRIVATAERASEILPDLRQLEIAAPGAFLARFDGPAGLFRRVNGGGADE